MSDSSVDSGGYREIEEQLSRDPGSVVQRLSAFHRIPTSSFKSTECPSKNHKSFYYNKATEIRDKSYQKFCEREWSFRQQYQHQQPTLKHTPLQMRVNKRLHCLKSFSPEYPAIIHPLSAAPRLQLTAGFLISQYHNRYITPHYLVPHWTLRNAINDGFCTANNPILSHIHSMPSNIGPFIEEQPLYPTIFIQSGTFPVYKPSDQRRLRTPGTSPLSSETNIETTTAESSDEANGWRNNMSDFNQRKSSRHPQMVTSFSSDQFSISHTRWASNNAKIGFNCNRSRGATEPPAGQGSRSRGATEPPAGQGSRMVSRYNCRQCTYSTDRKNNLKRHVIAMHRRTDRVLECCGMTFENKSLLRSHVTACHVHGYACAVCRRTFRRKALYTRHMAVHNGRKHYACKRCDYATSHKSNLIRHNRVHMHPVTAVTEQTSYVRNTPKNRQITDQTSNVENTHKHCQIIEQTSHVENTLEHRQMRFSRQNSFSCDLSLIDDAQDLKNGISNDKSKKSNTIAFNNHYRDNMNSLASLLQHETSSAEKNPNELVIGGDFNSDFDVRSTVMKQKQPEHLNFELDMDCVDDITSVVDMNEQMDEDCNPYFDIFKCASIDRDDNEGKDDEIIDVVL